ncbi:hypothetical protein TrST_g13357 [Triparma strigata]|uniref:Uncharacterized protein n=1 Tax=Triparma strigata TaxID=1606541 RepID=A0A9W7BKX1_9STRA|nr:hypothetical protein TrST_g13357 [Triparma strigata]
MSTGPQAQLDQTKAGSKRPGLNSSQVSFTQPSTIPLNSTDNVMETPVVAERSMYESEIAKVRKENAHLKDQTARLNAELRAYQVQFPYANVDTKVQGVDLPPWMKKEEVMSPLIKAYDSRISELGSITEKQRLALDTFAEQCEHLVAENELLRENQLKDLKTVMQDDITIDGKRTGPGGGGASVTMQELGDVEERVRILMEENGLMAEQNAMLSKELEKLQEEIMQREQNIITLTQSMGDAASSMQMLEKNNGSLEEEKKECEAQLMMKVNESMALEEVAKKARLEAKEISKLRSETLISIEELKNDKKELENECTQLAAKVSVAAKRLGDLNGKLASKTLESDHMSEKLRRTTNDLATTRNDAEGMLSVMAGMEKQLSEFQSREEGVSQLSRECKTKVEDALLARDQANAIVTSLRREVAKLLDQRKKQIEEGARGHEDIIDTVKEKLQATIDSKDRQLHELTINNAKLKTTTERCKREKQAAEETYIKLRNVLNNERSALKSKFEATSQRISETEARLETESSQLRTLNEQNIFFQNEIEAKELLMQGLKADAEKERLQMQHSLDACNKTLREATDALDAKKFEIDRLNVQITEASNTTKHRLNETMQRLTVELEDAKLSAESARAYARDRENACQEQIESSSKSIEKVRLEKESLITQLEKKLTEEREVSSRMTTRNQELGVRVNMLAAEKAELSIIAAEAEAKLEDLEQQLNESEGRAQDLGGRLADSVNDQQERVREEGKLKAELNRVQMELQRAMAGRR